MNSTEVQTLGNMCKAYFAHYSCNYVHAMGCSPRGTCQQNPGWQHQYIAFRRALDYTLDNSQTLHGVYNGAGRAGSRATYWAWKQVTEVRRVGGRQDTGVSSRAYTAYIHAHHLLIGCAWQRWSASLSLLYAVISAKLLVALKLLTVSSSL